MSLKPIQRNTLNVNKQIHNEGGYNMSVNFISLDQIREIVETKVGHKFKWLNSEPDNGALLNKKGFHALVNARAEVRSMKYNEERGFSIQAENGIFAAHVVLWNMEVFSANGVWGIDRKGALNGVLVINDKTVTEEDLALVDSYGITLSDNGAETPIGDKGGIKFYYTSEHEGVLVGGMDYRFMDQLPDDLINIVNDLISAFHDHRETVLKLDKYMKPIKGDLVLAKTTKGQRVWHSETGLCEVYKQEDDIVWLYGGTLIQGGSTLTVPVGELKTVLYGTLVETEKVFQAELASTVTEQNKLKLTDDIAVILGLIKSQPNNGGLI
jgi:hypothetical protein